MVEGIGRAMANTMISLIIFAFIVGGGCFLGLYFFISWLIHHIHIAWV